VGVGWIGAEVAEEEMASFEVSTGRLKMEQAIRNNGSTTSHPDLRFLKVFFISILFTSFRQI
jgi:hypothetical protein